MNTTEFKKGDRVTDGDRTGVISLAERFHYHVDWDGGGWSCTVNNPEVREKLKLVEEPKATFKPGDWVYVSADYFIEGGGRFGALDRIDPHHPAKSWWVRLDDGRDVLVNPSKIMAILPDKFKVGDRVKITRGTKFVKTPDETRLQPRVGSVGRITNVAHLTKIGLSDPNPVYVVEVERHGRSNLTFACRENELEIDPGMRGTDNAVEKLAREVKPGKPAPTFKPGDRVKIVSHELKVFNELSGVVIPFVSMADLASGVSVLVQTQGRMVCKVYCKPSDLEHEVGELVPEPKKTEEWARVMQAGHPSHGLAGKIIFETENLLTIELPPDGGKVKRRTVPPLSVKRYPDDPFAVGKKVVDVNGRIYTITARRDRAVRLVGGWVSVRKLRPLRDWESAPILWGVPIFIPANPPTPPTDRENMLTEKRADLDAILDKGEPDDPIIVGDPTAPKPRGVIYASGSGQAEADAMCDASGPNGIRATLDAVLEERGKRYGVFSGHANVTQTLKDVIANGARWEYLNNSQREALDMIAHKIGRIVNGDPNYADSWVDIAGYAQLVVDELNATEASDL